MPGTFSIANRASLQNLNNSVSIDSRRPDGVGYDVSCSTSEYDGRHKHKVNDSAHDISLQVLEKFSLLTKFARDTTSHIFCESQTNGFKAYEKNQKKDSIQVNQSPSVPNKAEATPVETLENSDTLEVTPYIYHAFCKSNYLYYKIYKMLFLFSYLATFLIHVILKPK